MLQSMTGSAPCFCFQSEVAHRSCEAYFCLGLDGSWMRSLSNPSTQKTLGARCATVFQPPIRLAVDLTHAASLRVVVPDSTSALLGERMFATFLSAGVVVSPEKRETKGPEGPGKWSTLVERLGDRV